MDKQTTMKEVTETPRANTIRELVMRPIKGLRSLYRNHEKRLIALRVYDNRRN